MPILSLELEATVLDYRQRIYSKYASVFRLSDGQFDEDAARRFCAAFTRYLDGWLPVSRNAKIMDLACGSGRALYMLKAMGYLDVSGVDISPEQIALARQVTDSVVEGDVLKQLQGVSEEYDLILAQDIIEHLGKSEVLDFISVCQNALKPGGRLVLSTPNAESPFLGSRRYADFTHEVCFTPGALQKLLRLSGFADTSAREMGPYCHGMKSCVRVILWRLIRCLIMMYNYIEVGHSGDRIYTRDFLVAAVKPYSR